MKNILNIKYLFLITLFILAFTERVFVDLGPNIELITAAMILSSIYIGKKQSFWLIFILIAVTDRLLGNSNIFLFTWSGFLIPIFIFKRKLRNPVSRLTTGVGYGLGANLFFYLWTNFGVWALDSWNMYSNSLGGLLMSYTAGLPFLKAHLVSTLIFVPLGIGVIEGLIQLPSFTKAAPSKIPRLA